MTNLKKKIPALALAVILWAMLVFTQKAYLLKTGDLSLFLFDWTFLKESFMIPGGFLSWAGSFFTQFMYIPWIGALLWVILLYIAYVATIRVFAIPTRLEALGIVPIALLVIANMSLGYGIFIMRVQDYFFGPTLGYLFMLAIMSATWRVPMIWEKIVVLTVSAFLGYILAGVFALVGVVAASIGLATQQDQKTWIRISTPVYSALLFYIAPLFLYGLFTRYRFDRSWFMGMPSVSDIRWAVAVRLPIWILLGVSAVFPLFKNHFAKSKDKIRSSSPFNIVITAISIVAVILFWYKDANFKTELEMSHATDQWNWKEVSDIYRNASTRHLEKEKKILEKRQEVLRQINDESEYNEILDKYEGRFFQPTRLMVMYRDLALLRQNTALDHAFSMRDGSRRQKSRAQVPMVLQAGRQLYLNYGMVNHEYRWCLEDMVENEWCYGTLQYMAMHAIIMNESEFASEFLNKLDKTLFYRKWSRAQRPLSIDSLAMSQAVPYKDILPLMHFDDYMSNDHAKIETFLFDHFEEDRNEQAGYQYDCVALYWAMRTQNIPSFWKALSNYISSAPDVKLPKHVQEAVLLYSNLEKEDMGIPIDKAVRDSYVSFMKYIQQSKFRSEKEAAFPTWLKFGGTFYYYYYFTRNLQTF